VPQTRGASEYSISTTTIYTQDQKRLKHRNSPLTRLTFRFSPSTRPNNARRHQLLNLRIDDRVLHVVLQRGGVLLRLLQNLVDDRVLHNLRDLGIAHRALQRLLLALPRALGVHRHLDLLPLLLNLAGVLPLRVRLHGGLDGLHRPRVFAHRLQHDRLADVALDEGRVHLCCLLGVLERLGESNQLGICQCAIVVRPRILRVSLDRLRVELHGFRELTRFELCVAVLARLFCQLGVDVSPVLQPPSSAAPHRAVCSRHPAFGVR
jgi:hypothetical protein